MSLIDGPVSFKAMLEIFTEDNAKVMFDEVKSYNGENPDCTYQDIIGMLLDSGKYGPIVKKFLDTSTGLEKELFQGFMGSLVDKDFHENNEFSERMSNFMANEEPLALLDSEVEGYDEKITKDFKEHHKSVVYDQSLPQEIIDMYRTGQIIFHPNYLFVSDKNKKCTTNCRFKIYTPGLLSDFQDKYPYEEDRDILVSDVAGIFKVVDICKKKKVTQITLVNIPIETENFMREHKASFEDYFLRKARKDFYKSFKVGKAIDARDLEYSSLALGIFKHKGEYKFFTKSDICSFLLIVSNLYELHGIEFLDDLLLKYDVDNLISQYLIFEGNNDYDDSSYQSVHGLKCNVIAPIEFGNMLFEAYLELNENRLELVEDNMDKYLLNYDGETPLVNTEISNLFYNS